jgi:hypothetical protein
VIAAVPVSFQTLALALEAPSWVIAAAGRARAGVTTIGAP